MPNKTHSFAATLGVMAFGWGPPLGAYSAATLASSALAGPAGGETAPRPALAVGTLRAPAAGADGRLEAEALGYEQRASAGASQPSKDVPNPLLAPLCPDVTVTIITESDDSDWSAATLRGPGEKSGGLRRSKGRVGEHRVVYVGTNPRSNEPTVWLTHGNSLCKAVVGTPAPAATNAAAESGSRCTGQDCSSLPAQAQRDGVRRGRDPRITSVVERMQRVADNEVQIERSALSDVLANPVALLRGVALDPTPGPGIGILGIRPGSVLHELGLRSHDRLLGINGQSLSGPEDAMAAYARLSTASELRLELARGSSRRSLVVTVH